MLTEEIRNSFLQVLEEGVKPLQVVQSLWLWPMLLQYAAHI